MRLLLASLLCLAVSARAEPAPLLPAQPPPAPREAASTGQAPALRDLPLRARLTDDVIKQAVRDTLADMGERPVAASRGDVLSGDSYRQFSRGFTEAKKPSCLGPDALKHQPAEFRTKSWNIGAGGLLALPFWAAAIARGKCN